MGLPHREQGPGGARDSGDGRRNPVPRPGGDEGPAPSQEPAARPTPPGPSAPPVLPAPGGPPASPPPAVPPSAAVLPSARPATPPPRDAPPPMPGQAPRTGPPLAEWLRLPRPEAGPGIWRCGYEPREAQDPDRIPARQLVSGAVVAFLIAWLLWSLLWNNYLGNFWLWPLLALTPESWRSSGGEKIVYVWLTYFYYALIIGALAVVFGRIGRWDELVRRAAGRLRRGNVRKRVDAVRAARPSAPPPPESDPVEWPDLRGAGASAAADRLADEVRAGRMTDVDHARIQRAWQSVRARPQRLAAFSESVLAKGSAACGHPSGERDLPLRAARHDLSLRQVRIGTAADAERNPHEYRGVGVALEPSLLGTSALAVGPPGTGKTSRVARPVIESLCLQALAGQAAVVAVSSSGAQLAPDESFDVVIRLGRPGSLYDLDLYGGTTDPDEAAGMLAEALVGDLAAALPGGDSRRASTCLAQLVGPFAAAYGRFPAVPELRELLDGAAPAFDALRDALHQAGEAAQLRELDAYERQSGRSGDLPALLADRIALLDRPAFADFFRPEGMAAPQGKGATGTARRPFSPRALEHPIRVRIDLPERGHAEASRILARLVLAQFTECVVARADQSLFACLVLDDATQTVTPQALRGIQRLRSAYAGVLLTLRALDDVPEPLRGPLLGAVGCRMVCSGVTPWDAERFAEVWGTEWVQTRTVTNRQLVSDEPVTRVLHAVRRLATGKHVTAESVTVRDERRERWSASDLANDLQPGHAVLSFTTVRGERTPPILTKLGE